jgi:non-specific serine/threonine protein kinase
MVRIRRKVSNSIPHTTITSTSKARIGVVDEHIESPRKLVVAPFKNLEESLASRRVLHALEESVFVRQGDYWTIRYQCESAILKATRGLDYLGYLLRHQGRDIHVRELVGTPIELPASALRGGLWEVGGDAVIAGRQDGGPILDSHAKAEYKRRIAELRNDLQEATRFNDYYRAVRVRSEMDTIAAQLAAAFGLGGRDRRSSTEAERARSAVTKRIKEAINRIAKVIPPLGLHLVARIKTGYFCSYNPHPDRPVAWKF